MTVPEPAELGPLPSGLRRDELLAEVERALARIPASATVVLAVSGGPDSAALAFLVTEARPDLVPVLVHVRHGLRDDRYDVAAVRAQASYLGAELRVTEVTVTPTGRGVEAEARAQRYAALRRAAREAEAGWICVGHSADDQAETLLLRLARGTGVPGMGGMPPVRGDLVRPLLRLRRVDLHRFVRFEGIPVAEDPTNRDVRIARNRVRREIMPLLLQVGPDPVGALGRLADLSRDDARSLDARAHELVQEATRRVGPLLLLPLDFLDAHDPAIARRALRWLVVQTRGGGDPPTAGEVEALRALRSGAMDLPGANVSAAAGWLAIGPSEVRKVAPVPLAIPGETPWPALGWRILAVTSAGTGRGEGGQLRLTLDDDAEWSPEPLVVDPELLPPGAEPGRAQVLLGGLDDPAALTVRSRQPGDRIAASGGTRKLSDVLIDAGIPRGLRDLLPIVAAAERVLWVPGLSVDVAAQRAGRLRPQVQLAVAGR